MRKIDFVFYYEHWQRELYGILLLKAEMEKRGYTVQLSEYCIDKKKDFIRMFYQPEVVVFPWIYSNIDIQRSNYFYKKVNKIVNLQSEQIYSPRTMENGFFLPKQKAKNVYHVCWGKNMYDLFLKAKVDEKNLLLTGSINLDINNSRFKSVFLGKKEIAQSFNMDPRKKWIIFFSNFKFPLLKKNQLIEYEKKSNGVLELNKLMNKAKEKTIQYIERFLSVNNDFIIIYRPHPIEPFSKELANMQKKFSNFRYISDYTIQQWIKVCDKILTWNSTSAVDAFIKGKPVGLLRPEKIPEYYDSYIFHDCEAINTYEKFCFFLFKECEVKSIDRRILESYVLNRRNKMAYLKLADCLETIYDDNIFNDITYGKPEPLNLWEKIYYLFMKISEYIDFNPLNIKFLNSVLKDHHDYKRRERNIYKKIKKIIYKGV
jgi:surface carbohydrate biosynthesis protein